MSASRGALLLFFSACASHSVEVVRSDVVMIAAPIEAPSPAVNAPTPEAKTASVRLVADDSYEVLAELFQAIVEQQAGFEDVHAELSQRENQQPSFQLSGIRPKSIPDQLGLKNDDFIEAVNGYALRNERSRRLALASVRTAAKAAVVLSRNGQRRSLNYTLVYH